jgi:RNA polymerase sigma-70 factor, ECF subfamily
VDRRDLVERARRGDHEAFGRLVSGDIDHLYRIARLMVGGVEPARDAVQDALVEAWRGLPGLRDATKFDAWMYRLLVRSCSRQRARRDAVIPEHPFWATTDVALDEVVDREQLERGFRKLATEQRAVLVLRFYMDQSVPEIAMTLGVPQGTVKSRLHRGLSSLRAALEADARSAHRVPEGSI